MGMNFACFVQYQTSSQVREERGWVEGSLSVSTVSMVEMVQDSATLRQIQTEHGLTGSFKDKPLSEWLMRHNPSDAAWKQV